MQIESNDIYFGRNIVESTLLIMSYTLYNIKIG